MTEFFSNVVNTKHSVVFEEDVTFEQIALRTPLQTAIINGHDAETLIDWSRDVTLDHGIEVRIYLSFIVTKCYWLYLWVYFNKRGTCPIFCNYLYIFINLWMYDIHVKVYFT